MAKYAVVANVNLQTGEKTLRKDMYFSDRDYSKANIKRWLEKGYIKELSSAPYDNGESSVTGVPFYMVSEDFLSTEEIDLLNKNELKEYARHIGVPNISSRLSSEQLKTAINEFIELSVESDEDSSEDDSEDVEQA